MRQWVELKADEPVGRIQDQGFAAIVSSEAEGWSVALDPSMCRTLGKRLLELAADHERLYAPRKPS